MPLSTVTSTYWEQDRKATAKVHFEPMAVRAIDNADWEQLAIVATEWLQSDKAAGAVWLLLGVSHEKRGSVAEALEAYSTAEALAPDLQEASRWRQGLALQTSMPLTSARQPPAPPSSSEMALWAAQQLLGQALEHWRITVPCSLVLTALTALIVYKSMELKTVDYYFNRFDARMEKIEQCQKMRDASKDNECMNAFVAQRMTRPR